MEISELNGYVLSQKPITWHQFPGAIILVFIVIYFCVISDTFIIANCFSKPEIPETTCTIPEIQLKCLLGSEPPSRLFIARMTLTIKLAGN